MIRAPFHGQDDALDALARMRWRMAVAISGIMIGVYFGFILLIAFQKQAMGTLLYPGLSMGIALGVTVILATWLLTWGYERWANRYVDAIVGRLSQAQRER